MAVRPTPASRYGTQGWLGLMAIGAFLALAAFLVVRPDALGYDLQAYLDAALRLRVGAPLYQPITQAGSFQPGPGGLYLYAPPLAVAMLPVADTAMLPLNLVWLAVHLAALATACLLLPVRGTLRLGTLAIKASTYPVLDDSRLGNISVLVLFLAAVTWRWLERPLGSVALALSISVRPTQGVVILGWLLRSCWRPVLWTCLAGVVLIAVTLPIVGIDTYRAYLTMLRNIGDGQGVPYNYSLGAVTDQAGLSGFAGALQVVGYMVGIGAVLVSLRRDRETGFMVSIGASLLLSPLMWIHYLTPLPVPAALMAERGRRWPLLLLAPVS